MKHRQQILDKLVAQANEQNNIFRKWFKETYNDGKDNDILDNYVTIEKKYNQWLKHNHPKIYGTKGMSFNFIMRKTRLILMEN